MNDVMIILILVLLALVVLRGPKMLPKIGEAVGRTVKETKREVGTIMDKDKEDGAGGSSGGAAS
ncbi:MAG: twin-arginine translocase TatA/TatE family subunit [Chloroflexota bacterium]